MKRLRTAASILLLVIGVASTIAGGAALVTGFSMASAPVCPDASGSGGSGGSDGCLRESTGTIELAGTAKGGTEYWELTRPSRPPLRVSVLDSTRLDDGPVTASSWEGEVVLLRQDGARVETLGWGPRSASGPLGVGLLALGVGLLLLPPGPRTLRLRPWGLGLAVAGGTLGLLGLVAGWWTAVVLAVILGGAAGGGWALAWSVSSRTPSAED